MGANQGKPIFFMNFRNVGDQPVLGAMASYTVVPNRLAVHVRMAGGTFHRGLVEYQGAVALFAICLGMCALKRKISGVVVKLQGTVVYGPARRVVAFHTVHFQLVPVGGLPCCLKAT